jgi:multidrug efflux pump subunit AcrA (membrane-fusion protein)
MPLDLRLPADGELIAETRYAVFAPENGIIREVLVEHGTRVKQGDPLLTLDNLELSSQLRELTGQLIQHRERQRTLEARRSVSRLTEREQIELQSGLVEAASAIEHTERQIKLMHERLERLKIVAPADGVITSWNVKQTLLNRTVLPGDSLLQEIEPNGKWLIELQIPEDRLGYVTRYRAGLSDGESLKVEFVLATEPERRYSGTLKSIGERTELIADIHAVRAVVELDANSPPPLRDGAEVKARLNCGPHRAGFVWFRELIEVIQTYWWY